MKNKLIKESVQQMTGYVPGEQPEDWTIVKLNTNENPYPPSPFVFQALSEFNTKTLRLYPDPVSVKLREKIAEIHNCDISNVFAGNGSDEVLALCTRAFVENGGSIGYFDPSYSLYPVLADICEAEKRPVELDEDFQIGVMPDDYDCSLFFLTNPNAPTGIFYPKDKIKAVCESISGVVLIDEAYVDFSEDDCVDFALSMDNVIVARTLSKSFSLAGLRVGYAIGSVELINAMYKLKDSYNMDAISQKIALAALKDVEYMRTNVERIKQTRKRLTGVLEGIGYKVYPSASNFLWVRPEGITAKELFDKLREKSILVRYFEGSKTGDFIRITIGRHEVINKFIDAIKEIVENQ